MGTTTDQIANHLGFLGYKVEKQEPADEKERTVYFANHAQNWNFVFFELRPNFVFFKASVVSEKAPSPQMDAAVNKANRTFEITRFYYEGKDQKTVLRFEATYVGAYEKNVFSTFVDRYIRESHALPLIEGLDGVF